MDDSMPFHFRKDMLYRDMHSCLKMIETHGESLRMLLEQAAAYSLQVPLETRHNIKYVEQQIKVLEFRVQELSETARDGFESIEARSDPVDGFCRIPYSGQVGAGFGFGVGLPMTLPDQLLELFVPAKYAKPEAKVVRVVGDSAFGFGIRDGDWCLLWPLSTSPVCPDDIVAATVKGEYGTILKRVVKTSSRWIELQAAYPDMTLESQAFDWGDVDILGKVIGFLKVSPEYGQDSLD